MDAGLWLRVAPGASAMAEKQIDEIFGLRRFCSRTLTADLGQTQSRFVKRMQSRTRALACYTALGRKARKIFIERHCFPRNAIQIEVLNWPEHEHRSGHGVDAARHMAGGIDGLIGQLPST